MVSLSDERKAELRILARFLTAHYPSCGRGIRYLQELSGDVAVRRGKPPELEWFLTGASPTLQRGAPALVDPTPHVAHKLRARFHRHF